MFWNHHLEKLTTLDVSHMSHLKHWPPFLSHSWKMLQCVLFLVSYRVMCWKNEASLENNNNNKRPIYCSSSFFSGHPRPWLEMVVISHLRQSSSAWTLWKNTKVTYLSCFCLHFHVNRLIGAIVSPAWIHLNRHQSILPRGDSWV